MPRNTTLLLLAGITWLPATALAFSEAPLCAMRPSDAADVVSLDLDSELVCMPGDPMRMAEPQWTAPISADEAREALGAAEALALAERFDDALLALRVVEHAMPRLGDRIALRRAELLIKLGRLPEACDAYRLAGGSPERNVAAQARLSLVHCLLEAGEHTGETELDRVSQRYPNLIGRAELQLSLARAREGWNNLSGAVAIYRAVDLNEPETAAASDARSALTRIAATGFSVRPLTAVEQIDRAERMVQRGPIESATSSVNELLAQENLPALLKGRARLLMAKLDRVQGRWSDVRSDIAEAIKLGVPAADTLRLIPRGAPPANAVDPEQELSEAQARIRKLVGNKPYPKLQSPQLRAVLDIAVQHDLSDVATEALQTLGSRKAVAPAARFDAAIIAFGVASDESVAGAFAALTTAGSYAVPASYHHARALERMGQTTAAQAEYERVIAIDTVSPRYYAMWSQLRLASLRAPAVAPAPTTAATLTAATTTSTSTPLTAAAAAEPVIDADAPAQQQPPMDVAAAAAPADPSDSQADDAELKARRDRLIARLSPVAAEFGEAYPWLARAADLLELDLYEDAADEIGEAYIAWRDARGDLRLRSGLEAVLTGSAPPRHVADFALRKQRLALDVAARQALADVSGELGDPGVSLRFVETRGEMRPRAYEEQVKKAAAKYGVDPNLLFAVMRVESVYHRQIVSYAGAVGLMQIMPRTGMLIARKLGVESFETSDLLNPQTNVEFAAWYLSSLIKRFDGRLPLAIAAYNGGPHNVRLWMQENSPSMPLDAFLERIPFSQTHQYVRRVLTHYAAYRAQEHLDMPALNVALPEAKPDYMAF